MVVLMKALFWVAHHLSLIVLYGGRGQGFVWGTFCKGTYLTHTLRLYLHDLITS